MGGEGGERDYLKTILHRIYGESSSSSSSGSGVWGMWLARVRSLWSGEQ